MGEWSGVHTLVQSVRVDSEEFRVSLRAVEVDNSLVHDERDSVIVGERFEERNGSHIVGNEKHQKENQKKRSINKKEQRDKSNKNNKEQVATMFNQDKKENHMFLLWRNRTLL